MIKKLIQLGTLIGFPIVGFSCTATWNDSSSNWNNTANWTPNCVPNGASDTATFNSAGFTITQDIASVTLQSLTFANNSWIIQTSAPGNQINTNTLTLNSTTVTFFNSAAVSGAVGIAGNFISILSDVTLTTGNTLKNQNIGNVNGTGDGTVNTGVIIDTAKDLIFNGGTFSNFNSGNIGPTLQGATGSTYTSAGGITFTSGTLTNQNTGNVGSATLTNGAVIGLDTNYSMSGGTATNENSGAISNGTGSLLQVAGNMTITGGTFTNSNTGNTKYHVYQRWNFHQ